MLQLTQSLKVDNAIIPVSTTAKTSPYYGLSRFGRALFTIILGAMAAGLTSVIKLKEAKDGAATDAKDLTDATCTVTANTNVSSAQVVVGSPTNGDTITINSVVFTKAAATDAAKREFSDAAGLETCINHATYGVDGVKAVNSSGTIALTSSEPGEKTITLASTGSALTCSTLSATAYIEVDAEMLDTDNGFSYVAVDVANSSAALTGAVLTRGGARFSPDQAVGASKVLVNS